MLSDNEGEGESYGTQVKYNKRSPLSAYEKGPWISFNGFIP